MGSHAAAVRCFDLPTTRSAFELVDAATDVLDEVTNLRDDSYRSTHPTSVAWSNFQDAVEDFESGVAGIGGGAPDTDGLYDSVNDGDWKAAFDIAQGWKRQAEVALIQMVMVCARREE